MGKLGWVGLLGGAILGISGAREAHAEVWGGFDATRVNYAAGLLTGGAHDELRALVTAGGDSVGALTGTLTANYLASVDVFYTSLLTDNGMALSAAEQTDLQAWLNGGGVLIITADIFNQPGYDSFGAVAGVTAFGTPIGATGTATGNHPLVNGVTTVVGTTVVTFDPGANATPLLLDGANPFAAALDRASGFITGGCVLVAGDHNAFTDSFILANDNQTFMANAVAWTKTCGRGANGEPCNADSACQSDSCVDSVCCDVACGGTDATDCQACSVATGSSTDGVCEPLVAATECRAALGDCDVAEVCDGTAVTCPADVLAVAATECRAAMGDCDAAEACDGATADCPDDAVVAAGEVCRSATESCALDASCDGVTDDCPSNDAAPDGASCDDQDACTGSDACVAGQCTGQDICGTGGAGGTGGAVASTGAVGGASPASTGSGNTGVPQAGGGCGCGMVGATTSMDPPAGPHRNSPWWLACTAVVALCVSRRRRG